MEIRGDGKIGMFCVGALAMGAVVLALTALGATLLVACGGGQEVSGQTITVTASPGDTTSLQVKVGDTIVVKLEANATTGYSWEFTPGSTMEILSSEYREGTHPEGVVGAGGTQVLTVKVTSAGSSELTGTYRQQWTSPSPGAQPDFSMTIASK
jgi:predicted secreted protein